jgi:hypothetical protein
VHPLALPAPIRAYEKKGLPVTPPPGDPPGDWVKKNFCMIIIYRKIYISTKSIVWEISSKMRRVGI